MSRWTSAALARDFTQAVSDELTERAALALEQTGRKVLVAAGGVAANSIIRADLQRAVRKAWRDSCICRPC